MPLGLSLDTTPHHPQQSQWLRRPKREIDLKYKANLDINGMQTEKMGWE